MRLPVLIPYVPDSAQVTLFKDTLDQTVDGDGRNFWPKSNDGLSTVYSPTVTSQKLTSKQLHKVAYPVLMELKQDFGSIGRKSTFLLVVFTQLTAYDNMNTINLTPIQSDSCAAVYRVRGNLLNIRRTS